jgi:RNA polymerase sigma factor (sigma-70 family)
VQRFLVEFLRVAEPLQLWAGFRIHAGLRPWLDPEDLVQETCIRAFTHFASFDHERGSFRTWIFGIATKVLLQQLRALGRQGRRGGEAGRSDGEPIVGRRAAGLGHPELPDVHALLDSVSSITSKVARREALAAVLEEVRLLEREERWLLIYRGLERLPFAEIGARLGLHPEAVRARWRRLLERLRRQPQLERFLD